MQLSLNDAEISPEQSGSIIERLRASWSVQKLSKQFWIFFIAAFLFDFGLGLFFFLFNLFLANAQFNERSIGYISSALTLGNVCATIPVSILVRRHGLQKLLLICFLVLPALSISRTVFLHFGAQVALGFLSGVALSVWPVCFAPSIARLTTDRNRVFAFSISFATGIGTGTLAGLVGGWAPDLLKSNYHSLSSVGGIRTVLIGSSLLTMLAVVPILNLDLGRPAQEDRRLFAFHPYLYEFLPGFAIWSFVSGSFIPFAPIYFQKHLGLSLSNVGLIFSSSQLAQVCAVLIVPFLYRKTGASAGIASTQIVACVAILMLGVCRGTSSAILCYLIFTAVQFSAGPGFYGLLMGSVPESERSSASAAQNLIGSLSQAGSAALTGTLIVKQGYGSVFHANAALALLAALIVLAFLGYRRGVRLPSCAQ